MTFILHPNAAARKASAISLIKYVLACRDSQVLNVHLNELLTALIWKLTEAESRHKHKTRFQSEGAIQCADPRRLRHEHVFQRGKMIEELRAAIIESNVDNILAKSVGCTVTVGEHATLASFESAYGWERYRKAGIVVIDTVTGERL